MSNRISFLRGVLAGRLARWVCLFFTLVGAYDSGLSQLVPEEWSKNAPKVFKLFVAMTGLMPAWAWFLAAGAALVVATFEYSYRRVRRFESDRPDAPTTPAIVARPLPRYRAVNPMRISEPMRGGEDKNPAAPGKAAALRDYRDLHPSDPIAGNQTERECRDCKHSYFPGVGEPTCRFPLARDVARSRYWSCFDVRNNPTQCGRGGKWFEPLAVELPAITHAPPATKLTNVEIARRDYYSTPPHDNLAAALREAKNRDMPIFLVIYDENHKSQSQLNHCLMWFMNFDSTKTIVQDYFVSALVASSRPDVKIFVPQDDHLEKARRVVLTPDKEIITSCSVYANDDVGYKEIQADLEKWEARRA